MRLLLALALLGYLSLTVGGYTVERGMDSLDDDSFGSEEYPEDSWATSAEISDGSDEDSEDGSQSTPEESSSGSDEDSWSKPEESSSGSDEDSEDGSRSTPEESSSGSDEDSEDGSRSKSEESSSGSDEDSEDGSRSTPEESSSGSDEDSEDGSRSKSEESSSGSNEDSEDGSRSKSEESSSGSDEDSKEKGSDWRDFNLKVIRRSLNNTSDDVSALINKTYHKVFKLPASSRAGHNGTQLVVEFLDDLKDTMGMDKFGRQRYRQRNGHSHGRQRYRRQGPQDNRNNPDWTENKKGYAGKDEPGGKKVNIRWSARKSGAGGNNQKGSARKGQPVNKRLSAGKGDFGGKQLYGRESAGKGHFGTKQNYTELLKKKQAMMELLKNKTDAVSTFFNNSCLKLQSLPAADNNEQSNASLQRKKFVMSFLAHYTKIVKNNTKHNTQGPEEEAEEWCIQKTEGMIQLINKTGKVLKFLENHSLGKFEMMLKHTLGNHGFEKLKRKMKMQIFRFLLQFHEASIYIKKSPQCKLYFRIVNVTEPLLKLINETYQQMSKLSPFSSEEKENKVQLLLDFIVELEKTLDLENLQREIMLEVKQHMFERFGHHGHHGHGHRNSEHKPYHGHHGHGHKRPGHEGPHRPGKQAHQGRQTPEHQGRHRQRGQGHGHWGNRHQTHGRQGAGKGNQNNRWKGEAHKEVRRNRRPNRRTTLAD